MSTGQKSPLFPREWDEVWRFGDQQWLSLLVTPVFWRQIMLTSSTRQVLPAAAAVAMLLVGYLLIRVISTDKLLAPEAIPWETRLSGAIVAELVERNAKLWTDTWTALNQEYGESLRPQDVSSLTTTVREELRTHGFQPAADALVEQVQKFAKASTNRGFAPDTAVMERLFSESVKSLNVADAAQSAIDAIQPDLVQKQLDTAEPRQSPAGTSSGTLSASSVVLLAKEPFADALRSVTASPRALFNRVRRAEDPLALPADDAARIAKRFRPRVIWAGATLVFFALIGASLGVGVSVIRLNAKEHSSIVLTIVIVGLGICLGVGFFGRSSVGPSVLNTLLNGMSPGGGAVFDRWSRVMNALALGASAFLLAAACTSLAGDLDKDLIKKRVERLGWILSVGAALLVAGVLEIGTLYRLPASMMTEADARIHVEAIATTAATGAAVLFTALLLAVYLPALGLLRLRAEQQITGNESAAMTDIKWLRRIAAAAQLFSPILVGLPLDKLLGVVMQLTGASSETN